MKKITIEFEDGKKVTIDETKESNERGIKVIEFNLPEESIGVNPFKVEIDENINKYVTKDKNKKHPVITFLETEGKKIGVDELGSDIFLIQTNPNEENKYQQQFEIYFVDCLQKKKEIKEEIKNITRIITGQEQKTTIIEKRNIKIKNGKIKTTKENSNPEKILTVWYTK